MNTYQNKNKRTKRNQNSTDNKKINKQKKTIKHKISNRNR